MNKLHRVEKIGGDDSFRLSATSQMIRNRVKKGELGIYFFSALKDSRDESKFNTTDNLLNIAKACIEGNQDKAIEIYSKIEKFHLDTIAKEFSHDKKYSQELKEECQKIFVEYGEIIIGFFEGNNQDLAEEKDYIITQNGKSVSILGLGEIIAGRLFDFILRNDGSNYLDSTNIEIKKSKKASEIAANGIKNKVLEILNKSKVIIVPGYTGVFPDGIIKTWGRGYSDASAGNTYSSLKDSKEFEGLIFAIKKLFVICSADPRIVGENNVRVIRSLSLGLLLEMIGANGAAGPFINRNAVTQGLFQNKGAIRLYSEKDELGSLITEDGNIDSRGVLFVQSKKVSIVSIRSYNMNKKGYVKAVGRYFEKHNISIDNIVSSETSINITVNNKDVNMKNESQVIEGLEKTLSKFEERKKEKSSLKIERIKVSELYIGGEQIDSPGLMKKITTILADANINIVAGKQSANPLVVIIGVDRENERNAVKLLHKELIESI